MRLARSFLLTIAIYWLSGGMARATDTALKPVADTYLKATLATTAFGTVSTIESNNANGVRVMLLRFDLSAIAGPITHLRLELTPVAASAGNTFQIFGLVAGETWTENTVTWASAPGVNRAFTGLGGVLADYLNPAELSGNATALATFASATVAPVIAFDVSSGPLLNFIAADADKIVTFLIAEADPSDTPGDRFSSREAASGQPVLTVTTTPTVEPPPVSTPITRIRVVLVSGQSNGDGRAVGSALPANLQAAQPNVPFYFYTFGAAANGDGTLGSLTTLRPGCTQFPTGGFGPEVTLGSTLASFIEAQPGTALALVKFAKGGSNLYSDWKAGGDATLTGDSAYYQTFQQVVRNGLAKLRAANPAATVSLAGMIWVQGESDIDGGAATSAAYGANLRQFIADVRQTFCPTLPFFLSRISSSQTVYSSPADPDYPNYLTLRAQQEMVAATVPNVYVVDTDGPAFTMNSDFLHFNTGGQQALGSAFALRMAAVLRLQVQSLTLNPGTFRLQWNGVAGKRYRILCGDSPTAFEAVNVGAVSEWSDVTTAASRFYRVEELDDTLP